MNKLGNLLRTAQLKEHLKGLQAWHAQVDACADEAAENLRVYNEQFYELSKAIVATKKQIEEAEKELSTNRSDSDE